MAGLWAGYCFMTISRLVCASPQPSFVARMADNKGRRGGSPKSDYIGNLFRNRCRCAKCGGNVTSSSTFYYCRNRLTPQCHGTVKNQLVEMDFFMLFLQEHPSVLLGKQAIRNNGAMDALKARARELEKALSDATDLIGKLPIKALETKLTALNQEREQVGKELEAASMKMLSSATAPAAFASIRQTLSAFASLPADYAGTAEEAEMVKVIEQLRERLSDNETRKKLLNLLPSLVDHLVIDVEKKRYKIVNHAGESSGWRQLRAGFSRA